jgi:hypothetical protein
MMTPQTDLGITSGMTGAKRQSWRRANPRDVLKRLIDKSPDLTEDEALTECWEIVHRDQQQMRTIYEYWFANNYRSLTQPHTLAAARDEATRRERAARDEATRQEAARDVEKTAQRIRSQISQKIEERVKIELLSMVLPNGKTLSQATREELVELGGWTAKVANQLQPNQTVAQAGLTEAQLRALYDPANG